VSATARWRRDLESWVIPQELLDAVPDSPYGWPADLWKRRSATARNRQSGFTLELILRLLADSPSGDAGDLLDVGAGAGRVALPVAATGWRVTAVERDPGMLEALRSEAIGQSIEVVEGSWPRVSVGNFSVSLASHVAYDVADIGPFLRALTEHGSTVVLEVTDRHPWVGLGPLYRELHGLDRPEGPTAEDLIAVVEEVTGVDAVVERWRRPGDLWFESWDEATAYYGRRLVLPEERWPELTDLLRERLTEEDGRLVPTGEDRDLVTIWWATR
jgi:SAM-dependent methyltransferase